MEFFDRPASRRAVLRGLGVSMALPWLESLAAFGGEPVAARLPNRPCAWPWCSPATAFTATSGGPRAKAAQWNSGKVLAAARAVQGEDAVHPRPVQRRGRQRRHPQRHDGQPAHRRGARRGRRRPLWNQHRSVARSKSRRGNESAQPRAWLRAFDVGPAQGLFDDLQLAHFLELARRRRRRWNSIPPWRSIGCFATKSARATPACWTACWKTPAT